MSIQPQRKINLSDKTNTPTQKAPRPHKRIIPFPDPARETTNKRITHCTEQKAAKVIRKLDEHDNQQQKKPIQISYRTTRKAAKLPDLLNPAQAALVQAGFSADEARNILKTLFSTLAETHGGTRLYLPGANRMAEILNNLG